ncbi:MAG TPA: hypothetical protein VD811_02705 [Desulfuromonadales bacterium]|nr:hypothetical protein [Desulfuromonadales bacterium]
MRVAKFAVAGILALATAHPWAVPAQATSASAVVRVQATIRPWLKFSATQPANSYRVTAEDIRRGHIDLPQSITIQMQTNIREEIRFDVASGGPEKILLQTDNGLTDAVRLAGEHPGLLITRVLDMRIVLPADVHEGIYPLQVALVPVAY